MPRVQSYKRESLEILEAFFLTRGCAVASVWGDIFHHPDDESVLEDTVSCISWMYRQMEYGYKTCPGFFTHHSMGFM